MKQTKNSLKLARMLHSIEAGLASKELTVVLLGLVLSELNEHQVNNVIRRLEDISSDHSIAPTKEGSKSMILIL